MGVIRRLRSRKLYIYSSASSIVINFISIGCALSAPDGSSPRGYVWRLVVKHRLKVKLFSPLLTSYYLTSPRVQVKVSILCDHSLLFLFFSSFDIYRLLYAEF
jgi:hypothetical protein